MPLPTRRKGESESDFVSRCMGDPVMKEYKDNKQRLAICFSQARLKAQDDECDEEMMDPADLVNPPLPATVELSASVVIPEEKKE